MTFSAELTSLAPNRHRLRLQGRLDSATQQQLEPQALELASREGGFLILDCEQLDYVASAGLRVFLMAAKRAQQAGGKLVLCSVQPSVHDVLEISGFLKILTVTTDFDTACAL